MNLGFRHKIIASMMLVVCGVAIALLLISERQLQRAYTENFQQQFANEVRLFAATQDGRLAGIKESSRTFARSMRLVSLMNEWPLTPDKDTAELIYSVFEDEFSKPGAAGIKAPFFRLYDQSGKLIPPPHSPDPDVDRALERLTGILHKSGQQKIGYINVPFRNQHELHEIIITPMWDTVDSRLSGTLLIGLRVTNPSTSAAGGVENAIWVDGDIFLASVDPAESRVISGHLRTVQQPEGSFRITRAGIPHTVFFKHLNANSEFPPAYQLSLHSLAGLRAQQAELRRKVLAVGALSLAGGLAISMLLAHGLSGPVGRLVRATREIERGNYAITVPVESRDEIGRLASSFNEMAGGLLLKEKYRSVLDLVADKKIADELISGKIELGGEERIVSVLFCDIRGFTALSETMEPHEVIEMLNDHFTPLTRIVYEHHGAVDKFVGDLIMAIFGAPKSFGNDAGNAARCALAMIKERQRLNSVSARHISMGIGVATGRAVAGRMGSQDRMNYTVLGAKVNLASRLCGQAGAMEVIIDQETLESIPGAASTPLPELKLKGFASPVQAFKLHHITNQTMEKNEPLTV